MAKENNKKIIIPSSNGETVSYWSVANYGRSTWKHKWWVLGSTVLVGLVGFLAARLVLNPSRVVYKSKYSYNLATKVEADGTVRYLSGEIFNYADAVNAANLRAIKDSKTDYINIDVEKLISSNGIAVVQNEMTEENEKEGITYSLTAKSSYFASDDQARNFIKDVIYSLQAKSTDAIASYSVDKTITNKFSTFEYDQQIILLQNQYNTIRNAYGSLVNKFTSTAKLEEGTLSDAVTTFQENYKIGADTVFSKLKASISNDGLALIETTLEDKVSSLKTQADSYKATLKQNVQLRKVYKNELDTLKSTPAIIESSTDYSQRLVNLSTSITNIDIANKDLIESLRIYGYTDGNKDASTLTLDDIDSFEYNETKDYCKNGIIYKLANAADPAAKKAQCDAFKSVLEGYRDELLADIEVANGIHHYLYDTFNNKVIIYTSGIIEQSGHISSILVAGIAAVVALVASSLIVTVIEINKEKEAEHK